jgi:hypothetical protein
LDRAKGFTNLHSRKAAFGCVRGLSSIRNLEPGVLDPNGSRPASGQAHIVDLYFRLPRYCPTLHREMMEHTLGQDPSPIGFATEFANFEKVARYSLWWL